MPDDYLLGYSDTEHARLAAQHQVWKHTLLPVLEVEGKPDSLYALGSDYRRGRTLYPHARFVENKEVWPTFSGRQQFLIDHPWYEAAGEVLPVAASALSSPTHPQRCSG